MMPTAAAPADARAEQARAWALAQLQLADAAAGAQASTITFAPASADASFRRYFRVTEERAGAGPRSWIVMDAPPGQEDCGPFVAIARLLRRWGLNAPEILAEDRANGFLLLPDLGTRTFLQAIQAGADPVPLFEDALDALVQMQSRALADADSLRALPGYDAALLWREVRLFDDWYLPRHLGVTLHGEESGELERVLGLLVKAALAQPRTFVHRDFMPRNLMVSEPNSGLGPGVLDFQDAVVGPVTYDPISLFKDAFWSWPREFVEDGLERYWGLARALQVPVPPTFAEFLRQADWMGLQRHLKVLGIFARLTYRDGKAHYVADTPRFVRYVMDVAPRHAELVPLARLFEKHVLPKMPDGQPAAGRGLDGPSSPGGGAP
jgi:N-acetylmuramate 1-kinase